MFHVLFQLTWMTETMTFSADDNDKNDAINMDNDDEYDKYYDTEITMMIITKMMPSTLKMRMNMTKIMTRR